MKRPEQIIHQAVVSHINLRAEPRVFFWHTPNEGKRGFVNAAALKAIWRHWGWSEMADTKDRFFFQVMPAEAYLGAGSVMINIRQEWPSMSDGETFVRVMIHERDAEALCEEIMAAAIEARKA